MAHFSAAFGALAVILGLLAGLSALAKRVLPRWGIGLGALASHQRKQGQTRPARVAPASIRLDPRRRLTLVALDGMRFAVLTGGASDVLLALPEPQARAGDLS